MSSSAPVARLSRAALEHRFAGRDPKPFELRELALSLVGRPEVWRGRLLGNAGERTYEELIRDEHISVWLIAWPHDHTADIHDHGVSSGAIAVADGAVFVEHLRLGGGATKRLLWPGQATELDAADVHRVSHAGSTPALTIHVYSRPRWRMGSNEAPAAITA